MRYTRSLLSIALSSFLLIGCSSVPLGSMIKMATLDDNDLLNIRPQEIKTRISISQPAQLQTRDVRLALRFEFFGEAKKEYQFLLNLKNQRTVKSSCLFCISTNRHQYDFVLSTESIAEFRKYQREFLKYGRPEKYEWTVYYYLKKRPAIGEAIDLDLELKLGDKEEYFYLLKGVQVDIDSDDKSSQG